MKTLPWEVVTAWGGTKATNSLVARPQSETDCREILEFAQKNGHSVCPRGSGFSFGDVILNDRHMILDTRQMNRISRWDKETGVMVVQPGVVVAQVLAESLPDGWTLPSCPGGIGISVGGALSNNVHGKDSWNLGNFGDQVTEFTIMTADGIIQRLNRRDHSELFRAVIGGLGLFGVILEVRLQLRRVPSPFVERRTIPVRNLDESLEVLEKARDKYDFLIAWVDTFGKKSNLGRGVVEIARWVSSKKIPTRKTIEKSLKKSRRVFGLFPAGATWSLGRRFFHPATLKTANLAKYALQRFTAGSQSEILFPDYNFILNKIPGWEGLYRPHGYVEFQPIVPRSSGLGTLKEILRSCQDWGTKTLMCAIKAHREDDGFLSFGGDGYDIAIDTPLKGRTREDVAAFARQFYTYIAEVGGKAFLAKDEFLPRDLFQRMYPGYTKFLEIKKTLDPKTVFSSDMYRRLLS